MGDRVVHFPQGHAILLEEFKESSSPPWMAFPSKWPLVECVVRDLQYAFPSPQDGQEQRTCKAVKAILTLAVVRVPTEHELIHGGYQVVFAKSSARHAPEVFTVTLREWKLPDFLVPTDLFIKHYSEEEGRFVFETYAGKVLGLCNADSSWPHSPWDALSVEFDDGETQDVCPWECTQLEEPSWISTHMDTAEVQRIQRGMEELLGGADDYRPFEVQVDPSASPQYYDQIALPMYMGSAHVH
ncbi:hypothetical protein B484DRAFT_410114 [Ochromonadaceae sp. CCMP2298]|nr:hypothetical protein B484DRAFT_410114 [Ochromonadaceae sp. CCMP2298]